ncbi:MAG: AI-2E family transporter [Desulfovibrio sp.]|jgi:predicted PurR-regulated permease PerM|nr:AI-2E family transporter [Mailhella sp.]
MSCALAILAAVIWLVILSPYPNLAFIAAVTASLTLPVYRWLRGRLSRHIAAGTFFAGMLVCIVTPVTIAAVMVIPQVVAGARRLSAWWMSGHAIPPGISQYVSSVQQYVIRIFPEAAGYIDSLETLIGDNADTAIKFILSKSLSLVNIAGNAMGFFWDMLLLAVFATLFVAYAPVIFRVCMQILPRHEMMLRRFSRILYNASRSVFISIVFVPIIQGVLTGIGLKIFDVPDPAFWGLLAVFVAVIPMAGTAIVWLPIALYLMAARSMTDGFLLIAWGAVVVAGADNLLRPYFLKTGIDVSMFVLLFSIVCSLAVFGAVGIIAGPVLVAVARQALLESEVLSRSGGCAAQDQ